MCFEDILNEIGKIIFNGLWGDQRLLYLTILLVLNLVYVATRPPGKVTPLSSKKSLRTIAILDSLRLMLTSYVILIAIRAMLVFLDEGIVSFFLGTTIFILTIAVFITLINTVVADLGTMADRGSYVSGIIKWLKTVIGFLLVKENKEVNSVKTTTEVKEKKDKEEVQK